GMRARSVSETDGIPAWAVAGQQSSRTAMAGAIRERNATVRPPGRGTRPPPRTGNLGRRPDDSHGNPPRRPPPERTAVLRPTRPSLWSGRHLVAAEGPPHALPEGHLSHPAHQGADLVELPEELPDLARPRAAPDGNAQP